jgi:arginine N-succinyltransferase
MILLREVQERDVDALERLGQVPGMFNLAGDTDAIRERIARSRASFAASGGGAPVSSEAKYIFVAEDQVSGRVVGTSMIAAQHGTPESPHFYFEVGSEERFSSTINTGFIHGTLKLRYDGNGPSELGGLVLDPEVRNQPGARIGRQVSFVRFLYLALHRSRFKKRLLAELLPPLNKKGQSALWEAIGRRFTNMDYWEADQLCQKNKEFILSLFPSGKIYTTFLSAEARNAIGKVGRETEPVMHMLTKIGFAYRNQVDPFDGGPHLWALVDELLPVKRMLQLRLSSQDGAGRADLRVESGLLAPVRQAPGQFRALHVQAAVLSAGAGVGSGGELLLAHPTVSALATVLGVGPGDAVAFMPYY